jgi:Family of unknown function (DUF6235)
MAVPMDPASRRPRQGFCLTSGLEILDEWSAAATQVEKNIVHQVLFAVTEKSVFKHYYVVDDVTRTMEFFVIAPGDLTVKIRVLGLDAFGIVYIGPTSGAPGLDQAVPEDTSAAG